MLSLLTLLLIIELISKQAHAFVPSSNVDKNLLSGKRTRNFQVTRIRQSNEGKSHVENDAQDAETICRIVTRADSKLPTSEQHLPSRLFRGPRLLRKLDDYFNARAHRSIKRLRYTNPVKSPTVTVKELEETSEAGDPHEEKKLVNVVRNSLEDAGFELLNRRDIDLCDCLNAGYLLKLSIVPDVKDLDKSISREFYPELFHENGTVIDPDELLFDGRVLVYWRGYSKEVTNGRLLLPKVDYLQASLVQRAAGWVRRKLELVERLIVRKALNRGLGIKRKAEESFDDFVDSLPPEVERIGDSIRGALVNSDVLDAAIRSERTGRFKLGRYGGSKVRFVGSPDPNDALEPFTVGEILNETRTVSAIRLSNSTVAFAESDLRDGLNRDGFTCEYDAKTMKLKNGYDRPRMELLERVSINDLVDPFTRAGRKRIFSAILEKSELVEPCYEEVVVVWRPKAKKKLVFRPPRWISDLADMFDIEGFEQPPQELSVKKKAKIELRNFERVPMANLPAVLPKTKLVFRPADAFLFDMISFVTFFLVLGSLRLDSPRLDLLAVVSVSLWIIRTVFRYSNKLARYDLLVKTFLTSKISHRNDGALKYLAFEAATQRAVRAALVYQWLLTLWDSINASSRWREQQKLQKQTLLESAQDDINDLLVTDKQVQIHVKPAIRDLEEINLIRFDDSDNQYLVDVLDPEAGADALKSEWIDFFDGESDASGDDWHGGNTTNATLRIPGSRQDPDIAAKDWGKFQAEDKAQLLNDFGDERRRRLRKLMEESQHNLERPEVVYAWQRSLNSPSRRLRPAFDAPGAKDLPGQEHQNWYF